MTDSKVVYLPILAAFFLLFLLFPKLTFAADYEVANEYKTGINYTVLLPQFRGIVAVPFKVGTPGNYQDFQFMLQQGFYIGQGYGFPASSPYFDPVTLYPTPQYFDHVKMAIIPSDAPSTGVYPNQPDYVYWNFYGDTKSALANVSKPILLEPEFIKDSTRYKWLQFKLTNGVNLNTDKWYWLILYTDTNLDAWEEWEFTGMKISVDYAKSPDATNNFGVVKGWNENLSWFYLNTGEFLGFRIGNSIPAPPSKIPVVLIPGIGGSEFKAGKDIQSSIFPCGASSNPLLYPKDTLIWVNELEAAATGCDDYFDVLKLKPDGVTADYPDVVLNGTIYKSSYGKLIQFLINNGYELNKTLFVFPYDWRKDIALTSPLLGNLITSIKSQTGTAKVDLIAHSMGGLVARNYIKDAANAGNVRKLITLGTPYLGSPLIMKFILYGDYFGGHFGPIGLAPSEGKDMVQNLLGAFELFPTEKYFTFYNGSDESHLKPFSDQRDIDNNNIVGDLDYSQTKQLLANLGHNTSLFNQTENFHSLDNNLNQTNGVEVTSIVGSGLPTLSQIQEKNLVNFAGIKIPKKDELNSNGDGTVPLLSAALKDSTTSIDLVPQIKVLYARYSHGGLVGADSVLEFIKDKIDGNNNISSDLHEQPLPLEGRQVSVHSPVEIHAYDSFGNHTGPLPNGEFEASIPGSSYDTLDDSKYIWLPGGGNFTIKLVATAAGSFDLKVRDYQNDTNTETTTYQEVPISKTSKGEVVLADSPTSPQLLLDGDGNGTVDRVIDSSSTLNEEQALDQNPPETTANLVGTQGTNGWYTSDVAVTLSATDDNSGVLKTEYSLDNGQTSQVYATPFVVNKEGIGKLLFKSVDKAGNGESPQNVALKIDKTKPIVKISAKPNVLWPPMLKLVNVKISGSAFDNGSGVISKSFAVVDEYGKVQPKLTDFGQTIKLMSWRNLPDWDGRVYTIKVKVADLAGNTTDAQTTVLVPLFPPRN